jgi:hypothetical protein
MPAMAAKVQADAEKSAFARKNRILDDHLTLTSFAVPLLACAIAVGCSWSPRSSPPDVSHVSKGLQETSNCILTGLNKNPVAATITNSVNIVESGNIEEIIGTSGAYQLYIVRLTAEKDDTEVEVFHVVNSAEYKISNLQSALSPCVSGLKIRTNIGGGLKAQRKGNWTGESR